MRSEKGSAMIVALVIVMVVAGLSMAFLVETIWISKHADSARESDEAQMICEAALEKARRALYVYKTSGTYDWDRILEDHAELSLDPQAHWDDYVRNGENQREHDPLDDAPLPGDPGFFLGITTSFAQGGFFIVIRDNDDGDGDDLTDSDDHLLIYVTASLPDGTQRQIEALVYWQNPQFVPGFGILLDGNGRFNGTPDIDGAMGRVHANGDLDLVGGPQFSVSANATGEINEGSSPVPPEGFNEHVSAVDVPSIVPEDYRSEMTFALQANGEVVDMLTGEVIGRDTFGGWRKSSDGWSFSGNAVTAPGAYFVEGNARMTGSGDSLYQVMTVVATGSIDVAGNVKFSPYLENTLFLAGGDLSLNGNAGSILEGLAAANEQVRTQGTFSLTGALVAKNAANRFPHVTETDFGGTMTIRYDGGMQTIVENPLATVPIRAMRRLK